MMNSSVKINNEIPVSCDTPAVTAVVVVSPPKKWSAVVGKAPTEHEEVVEPQDDLMDLPKSGYHRKPVYNKRFAITKHVVQEEPDHVRDELFYSSLEQFRKRVLDEITLSYDVLRKQLDNEQYIMKNGVKSDGLCLQLSELRRMKAKMATPPLDFLADEDIINGYTFSRSKTYSTPNFQNAVWGVYSKLFSSHKVDVFSLGRSNRSMLKIYL